MNVLIVSPFYEVNPSISRPSFVAVVLRKSGFNTTVLTSDFSHPTKVIRKLESCVQLKSIRYRNNTSIFRFLSHFVLSLKFACWIIYNKKRFDKIYVTIPFGLTAYLVSFFVRENLVVDIVDFWPDSLPFPNRLKNLLFPIFSFWRFLNCSAVNRSGKVMSLSSRFLEDVGMSASGTQIYLGAKKAITEKKVVEQDTLRVLYIGNVGKLYDFFTLIDAIKSCSFKCRIEIVGVGDELEAVVRLMEDSKIPHKVHGAIYDEQSIAKIAAHSDIAFNGFVDTTASLSYKSVLYMSHGLPILNSMKGDLWEIVDEYNIGFNYNSKDRQSLINALKLFWELKQSVKDWARLESDVETIFKNKFEYNVVASQILELFSDEKSF